MLYGHSYQSLKDFSFDNVWNEIESNIPFLVNIMNAVCGQSFTTPDLRVKYGFIYSILMSERWHELSLLNLVHIGSSQSSQSSGSFQKLLRRPGRPYVNQPIFLGTTETTETTTVVWIESSSIRTTETTVKFL